MPSYVDENEAIINRWCREGWEWSRPVTHEQFARAQAGDFRLLLTPTKPVPREWLGELTGKQVLALASGGGQQGPILTALGAQVTVLDYSREQLAREREVQQREGYDIALVRADMTQPLPFADGSFDCIVHPVSNLYVREVLPIWRECYRVLRPGGRLLAGLCNGMNYIVNDDETAIANALPFDPLTNPGHRALSLSRGDGYQFSHTAEEQLAGQMRAGFWLRDLYEDTNGAGRLHELHIPTFWATLAQKP